MRLSAWVTLRKAAWARLWVGLGLVLAADLLWFLVNDRVKLLAYWILDPVKKNKTEFR